MPPITLLSRLEKLDRRWIFLAVALSFASSASGQIAGKDAPFSIVGFQFTEGEFSKTSGGEIRLDLESINTIFYPDTVNPARGGSIGTDYVLDSTKAFGWKLGDRIGVFSSGQSLYFVAEVSGFSIESMRHHDAGFFVQAHFKPTNPNMLFDKDSVWGDGNLIIWRPEGKIAGSANQFDPRIFTGAYRFKKSVGLPLGQTIKGMLNDSLRAAGLETVPPLLLLSFGAFVPADSLGKFSYQRVVAPFVTSTKFGINDLILLTSRQFDCREFDTLVYDSLWIAAALTDSEELSILSDSLNCAKSYYRLDKRLFINGIVDLDFDGKYEVIVTEYEADTGVTYWNSTTYVITFKRGKPERIGLETGGGGC